MRRWFEAIIGYVKDCQARGMCEERRKATRRELERFMCWVLGSEPSLTLDQITMEMLSAYLSQRGKLRSKSTMSDVLSKLRCFGAWLVQAGYWEKSPLVWMKGPKIDPYAKAPQRISREAMTKLWQGAATVQTSYGRKQWLCALALLYGLGLRRGEVARLNLKDWHSTEGLIRADARKPGKQLSLPLLEMVSRCVEAYLSEREQYLQELGKSEEPALFINRRGGRLSGSSLWSGISRIAKRMEVPLERLHQFRHTCASDLIEAGVSLPEVQRILGHSSISSTVRYLHFSDPQRRAAMERHPLTDWLQQRGGAA